MINAAQHNYFIWLEIFVMMICCHVFVGSRLRQAQYLHHVDSAGGHWAGFQLNM